jgi:hypothetical protein
MHFPTDTAFDLLADPLDKDQQVFRERHKLCKICAKDVLQLAGPAMAGVRAGRPGKARHLVLRDEEFDIHIKIWGDENRRKIRGQLLPRSGSQFVEPAQCHLLRHGARFQSTTTDETGEFHFSGVPEGDLTLQIDLPDLTIVGSLNVEDTS